MTRLSCRRPDSQEYLDADPDNDGCICGIALRTPSP